MVRRDLFKKQSYPFFKALHKLRDDVGDKKALLTPEEAWERLGQLLKQEKKVALQEVLTLPSEQLISLLVKEQLDLDHLDLLADVLCALADKVRETSSFFSKIEIYSYCLALYRHVEQHETAFSLQRHYKIQRLTALI